VGSGERSKLAALIPGHGARLTARIRAGTASRSTRRNAALRLAAAAVAATLTASTARHTRDAEAIRDRWEATVDVFVASEDLEVGDAVDDSDWRSERRPAALVPSGAIDTPPPADTLATAQILAGEVLVDRRLATSGEGHSAIPPGRSAVDLHMERESLGIGVGDHVDVLTTAEPLVGFEATGSPSPPEALVVARDAVVLSSSGTEFGHMLTVAVTDADLATTAAASMSGAVVVVKRNPSG